MRNQWRLTVLNQEVVAETPPGSSLLPHVRNQWRLTVLKQEVVAETPPGSSPLPHVRNPWRLTVLKQEVGWHLVLDLVCGAFITAAPKDQDPEWHMGSLCRWRGSTGSLSCCYTEHWAPQSPQVVAAAVKLKDAHSLEEKL